MSIYEKEWECCGDVTITKSWQPEKCPFCTTPPSKPWVSLTDEEMLALIAYEPHPLANRTAIIKAVERLLKEKNHGYSKG